MAARTNCFIHFVRFAWPPILGVVTFATLALRAPTNIQLRHTHGFYELGLLLSLFAAIGYTIRLRPSANGGNKSWVWMINAIYLIILALLAFVSLVVGAMAQ
jgi:hypothetical protein